MLKQRIITEAILTMAFFNPLQVFRMAAIALFDPELTILGPIAYTIIEKFGLNNLIVWAIFWPSLLGIGFAIIGYLRFKRHDLI
jgi:ABC-2 type transport system permease protein